jgi:hypothetical protein
MKCLEGKRYVLLTALCLNVFSLACLIIAFITPYWYISWPRVYSGFKKIGLWEVCFAGFYIGRNPSTRSYHGCWWILAPEFQSIRNLVMPPWFIIVQILITVCLVIEIINLIFVVIIWIRTRSYDSSGLGKRRAPFNLVQAATVITITTTVLKVISVLMFGLGAEYDINWMPNQNINYPHVSYGLAIVSTFMSMFGSTAHQVFRSIVREEYQQPAITRSTAARGARASYHL